MEAGPPASKPKPISHSVPGPQVQPTGTVTKKSLDSGEGGRGAHGNPPPHSDSLLKNSLEMYQGLKKANDIKIVFSGSG